MKFGAIESDKSLKYLEIIHTMKDLGLIKKSKSHLFGNR